MGSHHILLCAHVSYFFFKSPVEFPLNSKLFSVKNSDNFWKLNHVFLPEIEKKCIRIYGYFLSHQSLFIQSCKVDPKKNATLWKFSSNSHKSEQHRLLSILRWTFFSPWPCMHRAFGCRHHLVCRYCSLQELLRLISCSSFSLEEEEQVEQAANSLTKSHGKGRTFSKVISQPARVPLVLIGEITLIASHFH